MKFFSNSPIKSLAAVAAAAMLLAAPLAQACGEGCEAYAVAEAEKARANALSTYPSQCIGVDPRGESACVYYWKQKNAADAYNYVYSYVKFQCTTNSCHYTY